jgi:hypothetical protein
MVSCSQIGNRLLNYNFQCGAFPLFAPFHFIQWDGSNRDATAKNKMPDALASGIRTLQRASGAQFI